MEKNKGRYTKRKDGDGVKGLKTNVLLLLQELEQSANERRWRRFFTQSDVDIAPTTRINFVQRLPCGPSQRVSAYVKVRGCIEETGGLPNKVDLHHQRAPESMRAGQRLTAQKTTWTTQPAQ